MENVAHAAAPRRARRRRRRGSGSSPCPAMNGLGAGAHGLLAGVALAASVSSPGLPEVEDRLVPAEDGEAAVVVEHLEAEPVAVEADRGGHVAQRACAGIVWVMRHHAAARCRACRAARGCGRPPGRSGRAPRSSARSPWCAPAAWKISSRTTVPCTSFAPKWSATAASGMPIMIQYAFTFGTLSRRSRETAIIFRSSEPAVCRQPRRSKTVFSGWKASGMKARKPPVSSCSVAQAQQVVDPLLVGLDVPVEHRAVRRDAEPVRGAVGVEPEVRVLLARRDQPAHAVGEDLGPAARERAEAGGLELDAAPPRA